MNIARWFSYTRLVERELVRARRENERNRSQWDTERQQLENERRRIENVVFQSNGVAPPHRHLMPSPPRDNKSIPRAVGPFGIAARNARLEEDRAVDADAAVRESPPAPELSPEEQERVTKAAVSRGLIAPQVPQSETCATG